MKPIYKKACVLGVTLFVNSGIYAAVGLEDICITNNATASTTVGLKLAAAVNIWNKTTLCDTLYVEPGNTTCYRYLLSSNCKTSTTAATTLVVSNLYINGVVAIPESLPFALTGTSGTTAIENVTLANGAFAATAAVPSVITAGTLYTLTAGTNIPAFGPAN
jgi:hypothetical protein